MPTIFSGVVDSFRQKPAKPKLPASTDTQSPRAAMPQPVASLFYRTVQGRDRGRPTYKVGSVAFDLLLDERHELRSTVTTHAIENGSVIADHVRQELQVGSLRGLVSNFSLRSPGAPTNRAMDAWELFKVLMAAREPVTIVTTMEIYENVVVTSVGATRDDRSGDAQEFEVSFQQIRRVTLREVKITAAITPKDMKSNLNRQAAVQVDAGRKVGVTVQ